MDDIEFDVKKKKEEPVEIIEGSDAPGIDPEFFAGAADADDDGALDKDDLDPFGDKWEE